MVRNKRFCCVRKPHRPLARNDDRFAYNRRGEVALATVAGESSAYAYDGMLRCHVSVAGRGKMAVKHRLAGILDQEVI